MKLRTRLIYINLGIILLITISIVGYLLTNSYIDNKSFIEKDAASQALIVSGEMEALIDRALHDAKSIATSVSYMREAGGADRMVVNQLLMDKLSSNENYIYAWIAFEPDAFDHEDEMHKNEAGSDKNGRYMPSLARSASKILTEVCQDVDIASYYLVPKSTRKSYVADPATYELGGEDVTTITFSEPIIVDGDFLGVAGIDISLAKFRELNSEIKFFDSGFGKILNDKALVLAHPDANLLNTLSSEFIGDNSSVSIDDIVLGKAFNASFLSNYLGEDVYSFYVPIKFEGLDLNWSYNIVIPRSEMMASTNRLIMILSVLAVIGVLAMTFIMYWNSRYVIDSMLLLSSIIGRLAKYDLSFDDKSPAIKYLDRADETGDMTRSINDMQMNFIELIGNVKNTAATVSLSAKRLSDTSSQVSMSADEVSSTVESLAGGATEQARETESGASQVSELGDLITNNSKALNDVVDMATMVNKLVDEGLEVIEELSKKTDESGKSSEDIYNVIVKTNDSSKKISSASEMIASIAEQTNLLALNAAIEAARAGDAGRGFAVVAEEIRKLAEQSTKSTKEIDQVVEELINNSSNAVIRMEETSKIVAEQMDSVSETERKYSDIASAINSTTLAIDSMKNTSLSMELKKNSILEVVQSLSAIAEENAASTEEVSASMEEQLASIQEVADSSEKLDYTAGELSSFVDRFKL